MTFNGATFDFAQIKFTIFFPPKSVLRRYRRRHTPLRTHPQNHVLEILYLYRRILFFVILIFRLTVTGRPDI